MTSADEGGEERSAGTATSRDERDAERSADTATSRDEGGEKRAVVSDHPQPALRIVSGRPSPEEIAAVSAVLTAASAGGGADESITPVGGWSDLGRRLRRPLTAGPGAWRNSNWQ